jgi:hypothetical protein
VLTIIYNQSQSRSIELERVHSIKVFPHSNPPLDSLFETSNVR